MRTLLEIVRDLRDDLEHANRVADRGDYAYAYGYLSQCVKGVSSELSLVDLTSDPCKGLTEVKNV